MEVTFNSLQNVTLLKRINSRIYQKLESSKKLRMDGFNLNINEKSLVTTKQNAFQPAIYQMFAAAQTLPSTCQQQRRVKIKIKHSSDAVT